MRTPSTNQLEFSFVEKEEPFIITRPLLKHRMLHNLLRKLHYVRRFFPELDGQTIRVGLTRVASGMAVPGGNELWVNPAQTSYHTLAHEFVHLLQGSGKIPAGERSCDLYALARHWTLNDTLPYYVRLPNGFVTDGGKIRPDCARLVYAAARQAIDSRNAGVRNYIKQFEDTLRDQKQRPPQRERSRLVHPTIVSKGELAFPRPKEKPSL
ncbi:MAG: hypothetical protein JSW50_09610 [Candidatus Latescibacterota bacterium]|nr:MAG: hypothetical protein JSW50_09610 [Candidatus Latescibacterota bacterium]